MTSPLLTLNHLLILARDCYDESNDNVSNALFKSELQEAIEHNELLMRSHLNEWEHFFQLRKYFASKVQADLHARGWKEALEITRQQFDRYKKSFTTSYITQETTIMQEELTQQETVPRFNMIAANKRAAELAFELSELLKQIAAHS